MDFNYWGEWSFRMKPTVDGLDLGGELILLGHQNIFFFRVGWGMKKYIISFKKVVLE